MVRRDIVMELTQLKQFKTVAEKNSISLAARELHISQPALSTAIKKLEQELGLPLFEHAGNRIRLNEAGKIALRYTNAILSQSDQLKTELTEYARRSSCIRLGFCDQGPLWYCIPKLSMVSSQFEYSYYTMPVDETALLRSGRYDILISSGRLDAPDIISRSFIRERIYLSVSASHPLAGESSLSVRDPRIGSILLFILNGTFDKVQAPFWNSLKGQLNITRTTDYFLFSQMIKDPEVITTTTEIVRHYRNDGADRVLVPLTDPELTIHYHISYLKAEEKRLDEMIHFLEHSAELQRLH